MCECSEAKYATWLTQDAPKGNNRQDFSLLKSDGSQFLAFAKNPGALVESGEIYLQDVLEASRDRFFFKKSKLLVLACGQKLAVDRLYSIPNTGLPASMKGLSILHSLY